MRREEDEEVGRVRDADEKVDGCVGDGHRSARFADVGNGSQLDDKYDFAAGPYGVEFDVVSHSAEHGLVGGQRRITSLEDGLDGR